MVKPRRLAVFCAILLSCIVLAEGKTFRGVWTTKLAKISAGQYVGSFCFRDDTGQLEYNVNSTVAGVRLLLYTDATWRIAKDQACLKKLSNAKEEISITRTKGNHMVSHFAQPVIWHVVFVDEYTCSDTRPVAGLEQPNHILYEVQMLNTDSLGNPTNHFSVEETGLLGFYQLLTLLYFVLACIYAPKLQQILTKEGPMHLVLQLLTAAMVLQAAGALLMVVHLQYFSRDGVGSPFSELLSELLDVLSQFTMLYMLVSLSLGWTLGASHRPSRLDHLKSTPAVKVVSVLGTVQGLLFIWEQYQEHEHRLYHAHRSLAGATLVTLRILLAAIFASHLHSTVRHERSTMKKQFYTAFAKSCLLWFLSYPVLVLVSWLFSEYLRYKMVTMGVVLCQSLAVIQLYRLFVSRSLYWEVSALSSTLPLRMDKSFGIKLYS
ncbi:integral membrane protein GPR180 [Lingula anatina]|uniref:Integral membrane protein GPR180 n=1 Tax=Lingula anatina TaxID=7574 RepID=A0A1S3H9V5_LINAN|nr:integral membrane protein GPR180 [Lingula anatina]|eukprot:XP_013382788.1 integral membrane protein GPR180 [Lingula anatina]